MPRLRTAIAPALPAVMLAACANPIVSVGTDSMGADCLASGTDRELQAAIDQSATVTLCPSAVFTLEAPLILRQGTTLKTEGRLGTDNKATVRLGPGFPARSGAAIGSSGSDITIVNIVFDGNRRQLGARATLDLLQLGPGQNYDVEYCSFTDAPGSNHLHLREPCDSSVVSSDAVGNNGVNGTDSLHADGAVLVNAFSISCAHTRIENNNMVDVSGTGIAYLGGPGTTIRNNLIDVPFIGGNSAITVGDAVVPDHTGVVIEDNKIRVGPSSYLHVGIAVGLHAWGTSATISGVTVRGNQISGSARYGLAVDGCIDCTVENNQVSDWHPVPTIDGCAAPAPYVAAQTATHASGTLQPGFADQTIDGCLGEPDVLGPIYRDYAGANPMPYYLTTLEVPLFSQRLEQGLNAGALLRAEWDGLAARARTICPAGDTAGLQWIWRALSDAQYENGMAPDAADAHVRALLAVLTPGIACGPTPP
jgi:parallel beta-helix repeat protein